MAAACVCAMAGVSLPVAVAQKPVANLDENRLVGSWYEIGRLPNKQQKQCTADAVELITRWDKPGSLEWVDACTVKDKYNDSRQIYAHPVPKRKKQEQSTGDGTYKVFTIWPLSRKYDVLGIAPDNSWLVVGTPNHKMLWIYAKTPTMLPEVLAVVRQQAESQGFKLDKLVMQPHAKLSSEMVAAAPGNGR